MSVLPIALVWCVPALCFADADEQNTNANVAAADSSHTELSELVAKGRSQYLAGDIEAATFTFQMVEARDPDNQDARQFLLRIANDQAIARVNDREETRLQLIDQVAKSWRRPEPFHGEERRSETLETTSPLARKLDEIVVPSISFTRTEIRQVIAALAAVSEQFDPTVTGAKGVNMVLLDPTNQAPVVTLTLRNTTLRRALDFATASIGYQYELQADAVVIRPGGETSTLETAFFPVTHATAMRMAGLNGAANAPSAKLPPNGVTSAHLGPGDNGLPFGTEGRAIKAFLQQAGVNFTAVAESNLAYDGSAIVVTQTARNLERIRNILTRYNDVRQVEIEAKFMEVQDGALEELGVNWAVKQKATQQSGAKAVYTSNGRSLSSAFSNTIGNQQGRIVRPESALANADGGISVTEAIDIPIINNAPSIPGVAGLAAAAGSFANISGIIGEFDVNAVVRALSQKQGTDLLSAPKVTVLSGNPATMTVAQEMRYPQSFGQTQSQVGTGSASGGGSAGVAITAGTPQEFTSRNVGVELKVTPTVEEDGHSISLDLNPRVTEFDGFVEYGGPSIAISGGTTVTVPSGFYQPIFSIRDISTRVTIWDGATIVMGGLTREEVKKVNDKVPILGDLPLIGRAFRSKGETAQKRNLLIFVTASLVTPGGSAKRSIGRSALINSNFRPQRMSSAP